MGCACSWIAVCAFFREGCALELLARRAMIDVGLQRSRVVLC